MIYCLECMKEVYYLINCSEYRKDVEDQYILLIYYSEYRKAVGDQSILLNLLFRMYERDLVPIYTTNFIV